MKVCKKKIVDIDKIFELVSQFMKDSCSKKPGLYDYTCINCSGSEHKKMLKIHKKEVNTYVKIHCFSKNMYTSVTDRHCFYLLTQNSE